MRSAENFIKRKREKVFYDKRLPQIRWSFEAAEVGENTFDDLKGMYNFFIIHRNPELILNKTLEQFSRGAFHPVLELVDKFEGGVAKTVNDYLFASFLTDKKLEKLNFDFTTLPEFYDSNLTNKYRKRGNVLNYLSRFIDE